MRYNRCLALVTLGLLAAACSETISSPSPTATVATGGAAANVTVNPATASLAALGDTFRLAATVRNASGNVMPGVRITWSSSNTSVASVDQGTGLVTAMTNGSATITARADSFAASAQVIVAQSAAQVRVLPAGIEVGTSGRMTRFFATARDARGNLIPASRISWSSSDSNVAMVRDSGTVTALATGTARITATCGQASGSGTFQVGFQCYPVLPQPQLGFRNVEERNGFRYYNLTITNRAAFPVEFFRSAPDLPPCGLNEYAARAWVEIYADGQRVYGFCGLSAPESLDGIWFAVPAGGARPSQVHITLVDRRCNRVYQSTLLTL